MASASSSLIKGVLVLFFIGAVFVGLNLLLDKAPDQPAPVVQTPTAGPSEEDPAVLEAREIGQQIGRRVGEEIGRRVGETLVANLEAGGFPEGIAEDSMMASAESAPSEPAPAEEEMAEAEPEAESVMPEPAPEMTAVEPPEPEPEMLAEAEEPEPVMPAEVEEEAPAEPVAEPTAAAPKPKVEDNDPVYPIVEQTAPGIPIETVHTRPGDAEDDPQAMIPHSAPKPRPAPATQSPPARRNTYANWWTDSVNGKGLRIVYIGQSVSADGQKGISVITSDALAEGQNIDSLVQVAGNSGTWRIAPHRKSLFLHVSPGTYQLSFDPALKATNGKYLGMELSGPVTIR